jgi:hypothetical protein
MNLNSELRCYISERGKKRKKLVYKRRYDPPVKALFQWMVGGMVAQNVFGASNIIKDTSGTDRTISFLGTTRWKCNGAAADDTLGIAVGSGTTAVTIDDYQLATQIAHGLSAGQLSYGATTFNAPVTSGQSRYFEVVRTFTNNSGGTVTVREIGLISRNEAGTYSFLSLRDVLASAIEVADTKVLTVTYRILTTA